MYCTRSLPFRLSFSLFALSFIATCFHVFVCTFYSVYFTLFYSFAQRHIDQRFRCIFIQNKKNPKNACCSSSSSSSGLKNQHEIDFIGIYLYIFFLLCFSICNREPCVIWHSNYDQIQHSTQFQINDRYIAQDLKWKKKKNSGTAYLSNLCHTIKQICIYTSRIQRSKTFLYRLLRRLLACLSFVICNNNNGNKVIDT